MQEIKIFSNSHFGDLRVAIIEGKEMFCLSDVCKALSLNNASDVKRRLQPRGVVTIDTPTLNQFGAEVMQPMLYVNEPNLYRCIFQSRKEEAQQFQDWVFEIILPQIRQTGGYIPVGEGDDEQLLLSRAYMIAQRTIDLQQKLLDSQRSDVEFAHQVTSAENSILIRDLAKLITQNGVPIGQARLFYWLRLKGYMFQRERRPIQKYVEMGLFDTNVSIEDGRIEKLTTKVTPKGQRYFLEGFLSGRFKADNNSLN